MHPEKQPAQARLALVFRGGGTRWALPAASVLEVGTAPAGPDEKRHGLPVEDFGALLSQKPSASPQAVTLVLDCAPPRALCVEAVEEVADLTSAAFFGLPAGLGPAGLIRGVLLHRNRLILEAEPQALADLKALPTAARGAALAEGSVQGASPPGRALVFEAGELGLLGAPLPVVTGVLRAGEPCAVPGAPWGHRGLMHHERSILSLWDPSLLAGLQPTPPDLAVVLDVSGQAVAVLASRVLGVLSGFQGEPKGAEGGVCWRLADGRSVLFPELERWVFPRA
ncbi:MAG: chemotaxis protein CheW [Myxococcales bacterium]